MSIAPAAAIAAVSLGFVPYAHQREAHKKRKRFTVLVWHRRGGKTVFAVLELILAALKFKGERGRFGYIGPLLKQAKKVAWDYLKHHTREIAGRVINESELSITLPNGAQIAIFGADNPDSFRGLYFDGVVLDEVAQMKPEVWGEILRPALADRRGWALFIGTPKGINLFSQLYFDAVKDEAWHADMRRASETGVLPQDELDAARKEMSPEQYAQEFECDFSAAVPNALIPLDIALAASKRNVTKKDYIDAARVIGVDVARYGDDRSVIAKRQGIVAFQMHTFRKLSNVELAGQVAQVVNDWKPEGVFIDGSPASYGVIDILRSSGISVVSVDFGGRPLQEKFNDKRAEMWFGMKDWLSVGCIPDDNDLLGELTAPTYTFANVRGKMALESKDQMRGRGLHSPDKADALALTFAFPVAPRAMDGRPLQNSRQAKTDFDPYAAMRG